MKDVWTVCPFCLSAYTLNLFQGEMFCDPEVDSAQSIIIYATICDVRLVQPSLK